MSKSIYTRPPYATVEVYAREREKWLVKFWVAGEQLVLYRKVPSSLDAKIMIGTNGPKLWDTDERMEEGRGFSLKTENQGIDRQGILLVIGTRVNAYRDLGSSDVNP